MSELTSAEVPPALLGRPRQETIAPTLASVRDYLQEVLPLLLRNVFSKADEVFFELAEKAQIGAEQKIYFNAKKEIRVKRRNIEASYLAAMREVFHVVPEATSEENKKHHLLNKNSIDDPMFRAAMVLDEATDAAARQLEPLLSKITGQIGALLPDYAIDQYNCPISVYLLAENFLWACECLAVEVEEKIVILHCFNQCVLQELEQAFKRIHRLLLDGEIAHLTAAKEEVLRNKKVSAQRAKEEADKCIDNKQSIKIKEALLDQLFALQKECLSRDDVDLVQLDELVKALAQDLHIDEAPEVRVMLRQSLLLVNMLFQFILENKHVAPVLSVWMKHLYLPFLRAVLIDRAVLSSTGHALRRLLNMIVDTAVEMKLPVCVDEAAYVRQVERVIYRVAMHFDRDLSAFAEVYVDAYAAFSDERRRQTIIATRRREANYSEQRSEKAKVTVDKKLMQLCKGKKIPVTVADFLHGQWGLVMLFIYLKEGEKSAQWNDVVHLADALIDSAQTEGKGGLLYQLPTLLPGLCTHLAAVGVSAEEISIFLRELEAMHLALYCAERQRADKRVAQKPVVVPQAMVQAAVAEAELIVEEEKTQTVLDDESFAACFDEEAQRQERQLQHITHYVDELREETWLEFFPTEDKKRRIKIAAILKPSFKFIFVDRDGKKVMEKTKAEVVEAMLAGSIRPMDANSVFGKALLVKQVQ